MEVPPRIFQKRIWLRQGDPLSLFLFIIVAKGIADLLKNDHSSLSFNPIKLLDNLQFDLIQFLDDNIIFEHASWDNISSIKYALCGFKLEYDL